MTRTWGDKTSAAVLAFVTAGGRATDAYDEWNVLMQVASNAASEADYTKSLLSGLVQAVMFREATLAVHGVHSREADAANKWYAAAYQAAVLATVEPPKDDHGK